MENNLPGSPRWESFPPLEGRVISCASHIFRVPLVQEVWNCANLGRSYQTVAVSVRQVLDTFLDNRHSSLTMWKEHLGAGRADRGVPWNPARCVKGPQRLHF